MPTISKDSVSHLTVGSEEAGQRLDNYLVKILKGVPKSHIHRIIRAGEVRVNKKRAKPEQRTDPHRRPRRQPEKRFSGCPAAARIRDCF